ncbi:hypothetical protein [Poriferisphaera sp. WC338]|uniref:hypothetical protein n=1 Tax=Poriferisphaera sp. WC338 TaxID=3425129 RepID=UPI003D81408A
MSSPPEFVARQLTHAFLRAFCHADSKAIERLLAEELRFNGPLFSGTSAESYMVQLRKSLPERAVYEVIFESVEDDRCAVFFEYCKEGAEPMVMAMLCRTDHAKIKEITLAFDTAGVKVEAGT